MTDFIKKFLINSESPSFEWKVKLISSTRWNRNYNKVAEYYYKWEIEVKMDAERRKEFEIQNGFRPVTTTDPLRKEGSTKYASIEMPRYTDEEMKKMGMVTGKLRPID